MAKMTKEQRKKVTAFYRDVRYNIKVYGRTIIQVGAEPERLAFSYTIGNHSKGLPELLVIGTSQAEAGDLLNALSGMVIGRGKPFKHEEQVKMGGKYPVVVLNASDEVKSIYTVQTGRFYRNEDYKVQQVVIPDLNGRYPGDSMCQPMYNVPTYVVRYDN